MVLLLAVVHVRHADAQVTGTSFDQLGSVLKQGDTIVISDMNGHNTSGRLGVLTASGLELQPRNGPDASPNRFAMTEIAQIRVERHDSLLNGALIGFAAGAAPGIIFIAGRQHGSDPIQDAGTAASLILVPAAISAGVGALIDAVFFERRIVYRASGQRSRLTVSPWVGDSKRGVQVGWRF